MNTRALSLRSATLDPGTRSIEAVLASENPTEVVDRRSGDVVLEVLVVDGAQFDEPIPLLTDHERSIPTTIGSIRNVRRWAASSTATTPSTTWTWTASPAPAAAAAAPRTTF